MDDEIDPALIAILAQLWRAAQETPGRAWSLAKLSKQSGVPMSSLIRHLTALSDAALLDPPDPDNSGANRENAEWRFQECPSQLPFVRSGSNYSK